MKRLLSILATIAFAVSLAVPALAWADEIGGPTDKKADPETLNGWQSFFGEDATDTEFAGGIWVDKSVFTTKDSLSGALGSEASNLGAIESLDNDSFLVSLSTIASNKSITGYSTIPTDTMIVCDLSSSMYNGSNRNPASVALMVDAVNETIESLYDLNKHNRVGVVIYFGRETLKYSTSEHGMVLLPLDRYTCDGSKYLEVKLSGNKLTGIAVGSTVKDSEGGKVSKSHSVTDVAGTYMQLGVQLASDQLLAADPEVPSSAEYQAGQTRIPIMVVMSDGEPTAATTNYYDVTKNGGNAQMGNNQVSSRSPAETDFVTQLTASLAKFKIDAHYENTTPLFYTLSLGTSISEDVMDPGNANTANVTSKINGYWSDLVGNGSVQMAAVSQYQSDWDNPKTTRYTVGTTDVVVDGKTLGSFPSSVDQQDYVDEAFTAATADDLQDVFGSIVEEIILQSKYSPTLVDQSVGSQLSGYVELYDTVSKYMEVTEIEGILDGGVLYTGEQFCRLLYTDEFGTIESPTDLGNEFVWAVQARMGLSVGEARALIDNAFATGQLSYNSQTGAYSNYIGWFADTDGKFVSAWDGTQAGIEAQLKVSADTQYAVKSYGVLGENRSSRMLYSYVDVCLDVLGDDKGKTELIWGVPSDLLPVVGYEVALDMAGNASVTVVEDAPIRLLFEVGLRDEYCDALTIDDAMASDLDNGASKYPEAFSYDAATGTYTFFTNEWDEDDLGHGSHSSVLDHLSTTAYYEPSHENERYFFIEDTLVFVKEGESYVPYEGGDQPSGTDFYYQHETYDWSGSTASGGADDPHAAHVDMHYGELGSTALSKAEKVNGRWYVPAGTYRDLNGKHATLDKADNVTGTLDYSHVPDSAAFDGLTYATAILGNNGSVSLASAQGLALSKVADVAVDGADFEFTITASADVSMSGSSYAAVKVLADGTRMSVENGVVFVNGVAKISLEAGETIYVLGLPTGGYTINEDVIGHYDFVGAKVNGEAAVLDGTTLSAIVEQGSLVKVQYENKLKTENDLLLSKRVVDPSGEVLTSLEDREFTFKVTLKYPADYEGDTSQTYECSTGGYVAPALGVGGTYSFEVVIANGQTIEIYDLPVGTEVTLVEAGIPTGFTFDGDKSLEFTSELMNKKVSDLSAVIERDALQHLGIVNVYEPKPTSDSLVIVGSKILQGGSGDFTFHLEQWDSETGEWSNVTVGSGASDASETVPANALAYSWHDASGTVVDESSDNSLWSEGNHWFDGALKFDAAGTYVYRVVEKLEGTAFPGGEESLDGNNIKYEKDPHYIIVSVVDDNGVLKISNVSISRDGSKYSHGETAVSSAEADGATEWRIFLEFTNTRELVEVSGTKTWVDANDQDGKRPETITVNLLADSEKIDSATVKADADGKWTYSFTGLPKYRVSDASIVEIAYTVTEEPVEGYSSKISDYDIVNTYVPETVSIFGSKTWDDANDQDGKRPESITVKLLADGEEVQSAEVTAGADGAWSFGFIDMPKYANGREIAYTVVEEEVAGYETEVSGSMAEGFTIKNTHKPETTSITANKIWEDEDNQDGKRPESVVLHLTANGSHDEARKATVSADADGNWSYTWTDLPKYANGEEIVYLVFEDVKSVPGGYTSSYAYDKETGEYIVTNSYVPEMTSLTVSKVWEDDGNSAGVRPESITVKLLANGEEVDSVVLSSGNHWAHSFTGLYKYKDGEEIAYTVQEVEVEGYITSAPAVDDTTGAVVITNALETVDVSVVKKWEDASDQDGKRPEAVTVQLYANVEGQDVEPYGDPVRISGDTDWRYTFEDLPKCNAEGKTFQYTVAEEAVAGYEVTIAGSMAEGYVLTNVHAPETIDVAGSKIWDDGGNRDRIRPDSVTVRLHADGEEIDTVVVTAGEDGEWSYSFTDLPKYEGGKEIVYTVTEDPVRGYSSSVNGYDIVNTYVPETVSVNGTKTWRDDRNAAGKRPDSITIRLYANGEPVENAVFVASEDTEWTYWFENLPKNVNGEEIAYTVVEDQVEGYISTVKGYDIVNEYDPPLPDTEDDPVLPETGDPVKVVTMLLGGLALIAAAAGVLALFKIKKRGRRI